MRGIGCVILLLSALSLACSEDEPTQPPPPPPGPSGIVIAPSVAPVFVHNSQAFVATTSDSDSAVTWRLFHDPVYSDTLNFGTLVSTGPKTATYTAPPTVEDNFGFTLFLIATSTRDSTRRAQAQIIVPPVLVSVSPDRALSVMPATPLPFFVGVHNNPNQGFSLFVNGIPGGDADVGTFVPNPGGMPTNATYTTPVNDTSRTYTLLAQSTDDPRRTATSEVTVRAGFALPATDVTADQFVPEWDPTHPRLAYVRGSGASRDLVVYDFGTHTERVLTNLVWNDAGYDGRIAWSDDGSRLVFSEVKSGRRALGFINAEGTERGTFMPPVLVDFNEACFVPLSSDSIYVTQHQGLQWSLRAYWLNLPGQGRTVFTPSAGVELHSPDVAVLSPPTEHWVAFESVVDGHGTVRSMRDNGQGNAGVAYSSATARTSQVRWAFPSVGVGGPWITFIHGQSRIVFRVEKSGLDLPQRCYTDHSPESACDLKPLGAFFAFDDPQAVSRLDASGHWHIWIVDFPPSNVIPVPRPQRAGVGRLAMGDENR